MRFNAFLLAVLLLVSCKHTSPTAVKPVTSPHWVQSQSLDRLMKQIAAQTRGMQSGVPEDVESTNSSTDSSNAIAKRALELSQTARVIPETVNLRLLSDSDERAFVGEANMLCNEAMELHHAASEHQVEQMQRSMLAINSTCVSCHSRFKELAGDLDRSVSMK